MLLSKRVLESLLPPGSLWAPQEGEGLDTFLGGVAECLEAVKLDLAALADVRNPLRTQLLSDLEREYGVIPIAGTDEAARRSRLAGIKAAGNSDGTLDFLQRVLDSAGFNLTVYANNPPVDPAQFVLYKASAICGASAALCGKSSMGARRGEVLVNGAAYHDQTNYNYKIPEDPGYWPLFFFIGGAVQRGESGELTAIEDAEVPATRRGELRTLILKCKPLHSWAGLLIKYV